MAGATPRWLAAMVALAVLGAPQAAAVVFDLFDLTLDGPASLVVGEDGSFEGRYTTRLGGFGMPFHSIDLFVDGTLTDTVGTDFAGFYAAPLTFDPCGPRTVQAVAYEGFAPLVEESAPVVVDVVAPPGAPDRVSAEAGPQARQATVRWDVPVEDGCSPLTGFAVHRGLSAAGTTEVAQVGASQRSYRDDGLAHDTPYFYRVVASNAAGAGPASPAVQVTTLPAPEADALSLTIQGYDTTADGATMEVYVRLAGLLSFQGQGVGPGTVEGNVTLTVQEPCTGEVCTPEVTELTVEFTSESSSSGVWEARVGPFSFDDPSPDCLQPEVEAEAVYEGPGDAVRAPSASDTPTLCA